MAQMRLSLKSGVSTRAENDGTLLPGRRAGLIWCREVLCRGKTVPKEKAPRSHLQTGAWRGCVWLGPSRNFRLGEERGAALQDLKAQSSQRSFCFKKGLKRKDASLGTEAVGKFNERNRNLINWGDKCKNSVCPQRAPQRGILYIQAQAGPLSSLQMAHAGSSTPRLRRGAGTGGQERVTGVGFRGVLAAWAVLGLRPVEPKGWVCFSSFAY